MPEEPKKRIAVRKKLPSLRSQVLHPTRAQDKELIKTELRDLVGYDVPDMNEFAAIKLLLGITAAQVRFFQDMVSRLEMKDVFVEDFGGMALNVAIRSQQAAMDRLFLYSEKAAKLQLSAIEIQMTAKHGQQIGSIVQGLLGELQLSPEQSARVPDLLYKYLSQAEF